MNSSRKRTLAVVGVLTLSLIAAACGSDDNNDSAATTAAPSNSTAAPSSDATTAPSTGGSTAPSSEGSTPTAPAMDYSTLSGTIKGSGATFPKSFYDEAIAEFADVAPDLTVEYAGGGSGQGQGDLAKGVVDFAGTDGVVADADKAGFTGGDFVYVPTVLAPITVSYNLPDVDNLQLSPATIAGIFQTEIKTWDDPKIAADNPGVTLPSTPIVVAVRAESSGTTQNFTGFLEKAVGPDATGEWKLGASKTPEWPQGIQTGDGNSGVAQVITQTEGAIGYVDLSDAKANDLVFASVKNKAGKYVQPTLEATSAAAEGVTINEDLTFSVAWADGDGAYPISAQTWIIAYTTQKDPTAAENVRGFLTYLLTEGQTLAPEIDFAPLPTALQAQAIAEIAKIGG